MMKPMYSCDNCNSPVAHSDKFCSNCGISLLWHCRIQPGSELAHLEAMWEKDRQLRARKQYWYKLEVIGWIKAENRKKAKQRLEEYFSGTLGIKVLYATVPDSPPEEVIQSIKVPYDSLLPGLLESGISLDTDDALAAITHTQVRILWFKPYDDSRS